MKWNFLYQITAASITPDYGATAPKSPFSLSSILNWICWTPHPRTKFLVTPLMLCKRCLNRLNLKLRNQCVDTSCRNAVFNGLLYQVNTDKCTPMLLGYHFINIACHWNMSQLLKGHSGSPIKQLFHFTSRFLHLVTNFVDIAAGMHQFFSL